MDIRLPLQPSRSGRASSKAAALAVLATAQLVIALDYSIVNVALPDIGRALGFANGTVQWVISAYALTFGGFLLLGGRAADLLGRRRMFMAALGLFGVASLAGGLTRAIAVWGSAGAGGLSLGVLAGGVLTGLAGGVLRQRPDRRGAAGPGAAGAAGRPAVVGSSAVRTPRRPARHAGSDAIVDALVQAPTVGWVSLRTLLETAAGLVLLGLFAAGLGQGVAFTTMYVAAGTGVAADDQGAASAIASTAQQLGGSVGLAALV